MKVLVFGTFDHLHPGHRYLLEEARKRGELHVIVARDATAEKIKGKKPEQDEDARRAAVLAAFPDAHVVLGDVDDYLKPVREIAPDLILFGYDQELPPGVREEDLPCPTERLDAFEPGTFKSSLRRGA